MQRACPNFTRGLLRTCPHRYQHFASKHNPVKLFACDLLLTHLSQYLQMILWAKNCLRTLQTPTFFFMTIGIWTFYKHEPFSLRGLTYEPFACELYPLRTSWIRTLSDTDFSITNFLCYELYDVHTTYFHTNICRRTPAYEPFATRTFPHEPSHTNRLYMNFIRYQLFEYKPYPIRNFDTSHFYHYEHLSIRALSHTNTCK